MTKHLAIIVMPDKTFVPEWMDTALTLSDETIRVQNTVWEGINKNPHDGLFYAGFNDPGVDMTASLCFFLSLSARFVRKLSRIPDLESLRQKAAPKLSDEDLEEIVEAMPMITGAEYMDRDFLISLWDGLTMSFRNAIGAYGGSVGDFFISLNPNIHPAGRVFFHLVENKNGDRPFAFMATYSSGTGPDGTPRHRPLKQALAEYGDDEKRLFDLLSTVYSAAGKSDLIQAMIDTGELFHPLSWGPDTSYLFLKEIELYEASGVLCRIPDWWKQKSRGPSVHISMGDKKPSHVGMNALVSFDARIHIGDNVISQDEARQMLEETEGLAFLKNKWVPVDHEKLKAALKACEEVGTLSGEGLSFREAMRLHLAPEKMTGPGHDDLEVSVTHGKWLSSVVEKLKNSHAIKSVRPGKRFTADLRHYQQHGLNWLCFMDSLKFGACLADDMGLGKTVQILAFLSVQKNKKTSGPSLLIVPASLISNWLDEIARFAPFLRVLTAHPGFNGQTGQGTPPWDGGKRFAQEAEEVDLVITTYALIQKYAPLHEIDWNYVILDEAQAIKNPVTKQARTVKLLKSENRIVMTGTPIENRVGDIWSLFDFVNPGLLGNQREFARFSKQLSKNSVGYSHLRQVVSPYILRRLKTDKTVISDLPDKVEMTSFATLSKKQVVLYQKAVKDLAQRIEDTEGIQRKGIILSALMKFKQLCNHPDQIAGTGSFKESDSGKFIRLRDLCETIREKRERVLVFTQFKEMTAPLCAFLSSVFEKQGLVLHGSVPVSKRKERIDIFQKDAWCPFMVLSLKAGGVGLNLTKANHVVHFDRWWNPAVENQATDRAFRIGQKKKVMVHKFVTKGTIEEKIDLMLREKQALSDQVIETSGETLLTEMSTDELLGLFTLSL